MALERNQWLKGVATGILLVLALISAAQSVRNVHLYSHDFQWDAARLIIERTNPYALFLEAVEARRLIYVDRALGSLQPNQFPTLLLPLFPYALLPFPIAKWLWFGTNLLATGVILAIIRRKSRVLQAQLPFMLFTLALIASTPWRVIVGLGQHSLVALASFLLAVMLLERRHPWLAGILYALSLLKYTLTAPLGLYFLYKREQRPLLTAAALHMAAHLGLSVWLNSSPLALIRQPLQVAQIVVARQGYVDLMALANGLRLPLEMAAAAAVALIVLTLWGILRMPPEHYNDWRVLAMLGLLANLVVYHRSFDLITLLFAAIMLLEVGGLPRGVRIAVPLLLLASWYGVRAAQYLETGLPAVAEGFRIALGALSYTTLFALLFHLWRKPDAQPTESLPLAPHRW